MAIKDLDGQVQLGDQVTESKNIVLKNDPVTGDLVFAKGVTGGTQTDLLTLPNTGLVNYADDTAAAAGGVAIGSLYRTASAIKVRVA